MKARLLWISDGVVEDDGQAFSILVAALSGAEGILVGVGNTALSHLKWPGTKDTSTHLAETFTGEQSSGSVEKLVKVALNVSRGKDGEEVLRLDLSLGPEGWNVHFLEDISASVKGNDEGFHGVVALGVASFSVGHA